MSPTPNSLRSPRLPITRSSRSARMQLPWPKPSRQLDPSENPTVVQTAAFFEPIEQAWANLHASVFDILNRQQHDVHQVCLELQHVKKLLHAQATPMPMMHGAEVQDFIPPIASIQDTPAPSPGMQSESSSLPDDPSSNFPNSLKGPTLEFKRLRDEIDRMQKDVKTLINEIDIQVDIRSGTLGGTFAALRRMKKQFDLVNLENAKLAQQVQDIEAERNKLKDRVDSIGEENIALKKEKLSIEEYWIEEYRKLVKESQSGAEMMDTEDGYAYILRYSEM